MYKVARSMMFIASRAIAYGEFKDVKYVRNYDADTITFNISNVHPLIGNKMPIRVGGIDAPEIRGKCLEETELAYTGKAFVNKLLSEAPSINLVNIRRGKYFRIIADVKIDYGTREIDLAETLIHRGLAVKYCGGAKIDWCEYIKKSFEVIEDLKDPK